jgi:hypothetical protein
MLKRSDAITLGGSQMDRVFSTVDLGDSWNQVCSHRGHFQRVTKSFAEIGIQEIDIHENLVAHSRAKQGEITPFISCAGR